MPVTITIHADARCPRCNAPGILVAIISNARVGAGVRAEFTCLRNPLPKQMSDGTYRDMSHPDWTQPATIEHVKAMEA